MLLKMIRGCMADSLSVDGREDMVLTYKECQEVLKESMSIWNQRISMR